MPRLVPHPRRVAHPFARFWRRVGHPPTGEPFWQRRYYDFNVWSTEKLGEKLDYMHNNPLRRGLVERPGDWHWSSFRHYASGEEGEVEIVSQWTARKRERLGIVPRLLRRDK